MALTVISTSSTGPALPAQVSGDALLLMPGVQVASTTAGATALLLSGSAQALIMGTLVSNGLGINATGAGSAKPLIDISVDGRVISAAAGTSTIRLAGDSARLVNGGEVIALGGSAVQAAAASGVVEVVNTGRISARDAGVFAEIGSFVSVTNSGTIIGGAGVSVERQAGIVNTGTITGEGYGVGLLGGAAGSSLANAGAISADVGIVVQHAASVITNTGTLVGRTAALQVDTPFGGPQDVTFRNEGEVTGNVLIGPEGNTVLNFGDIFGRVDFSGGTVSTIFGVNSLVNSGTIGAAGSVGLNAVPAVIGSLLRDAVENSGLILGSVFLGAENDLYSGARGRVSGAVDGQDGDDTLIGGADEDSLVGGAGNDHLRGQAGDDLLRGDAGLDLLIGGLGDDTLQGGDDNDTLQGGAGADLLEGGAGIDLADYRNSAAGVTIDLALGLANGGDAAGDVLLLIENLRGSALDDLLLGNDVANTFFGGAGQDTLRGLAGNDTLNGEAGQDLLEGGLGNDALSGGDGEDTLVGGPGQDLLRGGNGADLFRYLSVEDSLVPTRDAISDFSQAQGDRIDLSAIDAVVGGADDAFVFIGTAAFTNSAAGQIRATPSGASTIIEVDLGNDGNAVADMRIILTGLFTLTAADFLL